MVTKLYLTALRHLKKKKKKARYGQVVISEEIRLEMNTNDAKEYLARREIPQLFEVRDALCGDEIRADLTV